MASVLMLLKTSGIQYDDRVRKEAESLGALGHEVHLLVLEESNRRRTGTLRGLTFEAIRLQSRRLFSSSRGLACKALELYLRCFVEVLKRRPDTLWLHCHEFYAFLPVALLLRSLGIVRRIVWDQHELPPVRWMRSQARRRFLGFWSRRVDRIIAANAPRRDLVRERLSLEAERMSVLENRADLHFAEVASAPPPAELLEWLDGAPYFVAQGGAAPRRHIGALVEALGSNSPYKLVVVGWHVPAEIAALRERFAWFDERVMLTGMVPQFEIVRYLDGAIASVVLYENCRENNWLCAPNRMYQAIARGVPVIVGANPPMASFVRETGAGLVLEDDGGDAGALGRVLLEAAENQEQLRRRARAHRHHALWESQNAELARIMGAESPALAFGARGQG